MKCPKCNGDKGQWDIGNYHWYPCGFCNETGEVEDKSRSVQRREALQKGEPMPEFDKPDMPKKFRKKPVDVEAFQWLTDAVPDWFKNVSGNFKVDVATGSVFIPTLEGIHEARVGDWIIKGVKGELYPCKPDIFEMTYEPADKSTNYLRADKVREVVRLHEEFRDLLLKYRFTPGVPDELNAKAEEIDNLQSALFPEGV
jgi:hypothetical protein